MSNVYTPWDLYFASVVSMRLHPGNKELLSVVDCAMIASEMLVLRDFHLALSEVFMATSANPFAPLVRMLEQRIARQKVALAESELQLESAKTSYNLHETAGAGRQQDIVTEIARGKSGK